MDPNLYHTLPGGIEVKVVDILILFLNGAIIGIGVLIWFGLNLYKKVLEPKIPELLQIGQLTHLADISSDKIYIWKQQNRNKDSKKKGFLKTTKQKQQSSGEEIMCKECEEVIKTNTVSFN